MIEPASDGPAVHHLAVRVADCERAAQFYRGLLGLPELRRRRDESGRTQAIWLRAGGVIVMLERDLRGCGPGTGSAHLLAFAIEDLEVWEARLDDAGIAVDDRTEFTLYVRDPDGHRVGLSVHPGFHQETQDAD